MELTPQEQKKLEKLQNFLKDKDISTFKEIVDLDEKVDKLDEKLTGRLSSISEELKKKLEEELSYEVDESQIVENVLSQIPIPKDGEPGKPGDNYILTDDDKSKIASGLVVPIPTCPPGTNAKSSVPGV